MKIATLILGLGIFFQSGANALEKKDLSVNFSISGKNFSVQGEKIGENTYVFNKGANKKIKIVTLDWAPYIGENICKQGWVQQFTVALLVSLDYEVTSAFYPWVRAVAAAETGQAQILYPEYFIDQAAMSEVVKGTKRTELLSISERIPGGPIAFMKRQGEKTAFNGNLDLIKGEKIGVVHGYVNTPEFDDLVAKKFFATDEAKDDVINAGKLAAKRVNLIIGDPSVIRFSVATSSMNKKELDTTLNMLETVQPVLKYNYLYYAISKKNPDWVLLQEAINLRISDFESSGEMWKIIQDTNKSCNYVMDTLTPFKQ